MNFKENIYLEIKKNKLNYFFLLLILGIMIILSKNSHNNKKKINSIENIKEEKEKLLEIKNPIKEEIKNNILEKKNTIEKDQIKKIIKKISFLNFSKKDIIGFGGNGTIVYEGYFQSRKVAIKRVLKTNNFLWIKEIEILLKIEHENIIKYYYFEEDE